MNIHLEHQRPPDRQKTHGSKILFALGAGAVIFGVEVWASIRTGSLGLLSDAAHALVDMTGLGIAYGALLLASRPASPQATYGYGRAEVLAAAINGILVIGIATAIVIRAFGRLRDPLPDLDATTVMAVGALSMLVNAGAAWILRPSGDQNINSKGAYVNVLGDTLASMGVVVAALLVRWTGNTVWDTIVSFLVAGIILVAAWGLLRGAVAILLERAPPHLAPNDIKNAVEGLESVINVHDLHVWTLTPGHHSLSMHVTITTEAAKDFVGAIEQIESLLLARFGLDHCTIQVEPEGHDETSEHYDPVRGELTR